MLTRAQAVAAYDFAAGSVVPDRLTRVAHGQYLRLAERMLLVYRRGIGTTRRELRQSIQGLFAAEPECPLRRIEAFCKLLDDASQYDGVRGGNAAALRRRVFRLAAASHPLVRQADRLFERAETQVKQRIAAELGRSWEEIDGELFADVIDFQRLLQFDSYADAAALLARYNVAQIQAALYDAVSLTIQAGGDFKTILRYAKLARLLHSISRIGEGRYQIRLDGPASVLRETRRYGAAMACFLPALIACRDWTMHAVLATRRKAWRLSLDLSSAEGLTSHLPRPDEFDSDLEAAFAAKWGTDPREGWRLVREAEVLHRGQKVFVPDFVFRHDDGRSVPFEIIGFWTPEYLLAKLKTLALFPDARILLAVAERTGLTPPTLDPPPIFFKTAIKLATVLERLNAP